mmetsp:Transcript_24203/g.43022  ORF Transcript_24203/g.43022 Transcript_24203/m.43022 type:complete len:341 (+) Transcript_24203:128-1150(+)
MHKSDSSLFILKRTVDFNSIPLEKHPNFAQAATLVHQVNVYVFDSKLHDWVLFSVADGKGCELRLLKREKTKWILDVKQWDASILTLAVHKDLQFTALNSSFASIYTEDGRAVGLHFLSNSMKELEKLLTAVEELGGEEKPALTNYYCFSIARSVPDPSNPRGASMKAVGVVSKSSKLAVYKPLVEIALDLIFDNSNSVKDIARLLHTKLNRLNLAKYDNMPDNERRLMQFTETSKIKKLKTKFRGEIVKVHIPLFSLSSELAPYSILLLCEKLHDLVMTVYDALLSNKRIIVLGEHSRAEEVVSAVLAVVHLVSPPFGHIVTRYVYPYATLDDIDFLNK